MSKPNVIIVKCLACDRPFPKRPKSFKRRARLVYYKRMVIRRSHCVTCSHECSKKLTLLYNSWGFKKAKEKLLKTAMQKLRSTKTKHLYTTTTPIYCLSEMKAKNRVRGD